MSGMKDMTCMGDPNSWNWQYVTTHRCFVVPLPCTAAIAVVICNITLYVIVEEEWEEGDIWEEEDNDQYASFPTNWNIF